MKQVDSADVCGARTVEDEGLLPKLANQVSGPGVTQLQRTKDTSHSDCCGALDVIIVAQVLLPIGHQQRESVIRVEVLKLTESAGTELPLNSTKELFDERVLAVVASVDYGASFTA